MLKELYKFIIFLSFSNLSSLIWGLFVRDYIYMGKFGGEKKKGGINQNQNQVLADKNPLHAT